MFPQVQQALEHLSAALDSADQAPTAELRQSLELAKQLRNRVELLETRAATLVAQRERHGDGGAGLLNQVGGLSRSHAARNVRTDTELATIPAARTGVSEGEISLANAARLAQAARKTSPQAVQGDPEFVELAKTLPADEFAQAAQRWTIRHQDTEELAVQHRRNRRNRHVRFWNGDDGSVQMRGSFDTEMGAHIQGRLRQQAEQLRQADRRQARNSEPGDGTGGVSAKAIRTRDQRMAGTLERLICNSDLSVVFFGDKFTPLYETTAARTPTAAQRRALIARDGTCIGCGTPPNECEAHHIVPWKRGGKTRVDNLVLVCWSCHDRIHDHNWQVVVRDGRFHLAPPSAKHQPNPAPSRKPKRPPPAELSPTGAVAAGRIEGEVPPPAELSFVYD